MRNSRSFYTFCQSQIYNLVTRRRESWQRKGAALATADASQGHGWDRGRFTAVVSAAAAGQAATASLKRAGVEATRAAGGNASVDGILPRQAQLLLIGDGKSNQTAGNQAGKPASPHGRGTASSRLVGVFATRSFRMLPPGFEVVGELHLVGLPKTGAARWSLTADRGHEPILRMTPSPRAQRVITL
jgi:hypothetical protein